MANGRRKIAAARDHANAHLPLFIFDARQRIFTFKALEQIRK
jgi:hypothetical protein